MEFTYEDWIDRYEETLRALLGFVGVENASTMPLPEPPLRKQANQRNREWVERFCRENGIAEELHE